MNVYLTVDQEQELRAIQAEALRRGFRANPTALMRLAVELLLKERPERIYSQLQRYVARIEDTE